MRTKRVVLAAVLGVFVAAAGCCGLCDSCRSRSEGPPPADERYVPAQPPAAGQGALPASAGQPVSRQTGAYGGTGN